MPSLNDPSNFAGRVNYAAKVISAGAGHHGRAFANCFENGDGDVVAAAVMRRAEKNPKIAANAFRALNESAVKQNMATYAGVATRDLPAAAARLRAEHKAAFERALAEQARRNAAATP